MQIFYEYFLCIFVNQLILNTNSYGLNDVLNYQNQNSKEK